MKAKYNVLYTNGKVNTFFKGALYMEEVKEEAIKLTQHADVLEVSYTIENKVTDLDKAQKLNEIISIWTGASILHRFEWSEYKYRYSSTLSAMKAILSEAEWLYGYEYNQDEGDIIHLHWFLEAAIKIFKADVLWLYRYLNLPIPQIPKMTLEEFCDICYTKAEVLAEKECQRRGILEGQVHFHQNILALKYDEQNNG